MSVKFKKKKGQQQQIVVLIIIIQYEKKKERETNDNLIGKNSTTIATISNDYVHPRVIHHSMLVL